MPCRDYLSQLRQAHPEIQALGAGVLAVGTGAAFQAKHLSAEYPFPLLVDPDKHLYRALGIRRIPWKQFTRVATWRKYLGSIRRARQGLITGDPLQAPGVVILDPDRTVRYLYRGGTLGDYPLFDEVLGALREAARS